MKPQATRVEFKEVEALRELYRQEANCQIIHDSALSRGIADPYLILVDGRLGGYGAVWNKYNKGRLMEFYTLPALRASALPMFRELLAVSEATHMEAQTNIPWMLTLLTDCVKNIKVENVLFQDACTTHLDCPDGLFRHATPEDIVSVFPHHHEPIGEWVIESNGDVIATAGALTHYNPPYADIFMEVSEPARRRGFGSYLVQEVKRGCYESGKVPAARCNPSNIASRRTLEKAGFLPVARMLAGKINRDFMDSPQASRDS